jgi:carboxyl-terminal processing protease
MKLKRSTVAPAIVLAAAVVSGGWFLQQGVGQEQNVYYQVRLFQEVVDHIASQYVEDVERGELYQSAIQGLLEQLGDPNTSFITASQYENFRITTTGDYGGVGLEIDERDGWITIISPIPGGPGERVGIRPGDQFYEIDGQSAEGWRTDQAVNVLRGRPGTEVEVKILRPGVDQPIPFTLKREEIHLKAVPFATLLEGGILYVPLTIFRETSSAELEQAIESARGVRGVILDLRGNPGGLLEEGIGVSDLFLPAGAAVVETRGRTAGQNEKFEARTEDSFAGLPVVVLVDGGSASASEIVAGALQDHDRALVIGLTTFGKGSVQTLYQLSGGNVLRLTTARWYTPVGRSIQKEDPEADGTPRQVADATLNLRGRLVPLADTAGRPTVSSIGGRTLYGGGGIVPDLVVFPDTLTTSEQTALQTLFRQAGALDRAMFNYAVRYIQERPGLSRDFELTSADLQAFFSSLPEADVQADPAALRQAERYFRNEISAKIAQQAWGSEAAFLETRAQDAQLRLAVEILLGARAPKDVFRIAEERKASAVSTAPANGQRPGAR